MTKLTNVSDTARWVAVDRRRTWLWRFIANFFGPARREEFRRMSGFVLFERR